MKKPVSPLQKAKKSFLRRWHAEDFPGGESRFQITLFAKEFAIYIVFPIVCIFLFKSCENAFSGDRSKGSSNKREIQTPQDIGGLRSQIIDFVKSAGSTGYAGILKKAPGALVKVRLLNVVETYSGAPVHAQVVDQGLGKSLMGATIIGDATGDGNVNRINMEFRFVRDPKRSGVAIPISARALSLDGTLGVNAQKKEGFFARASLNASGTAGQDALGKTESQSGGLNTIIAKALASGLMQEFGSDSQVARNRSQVLSLKPLTEFYVELTDYFPGGR